jgi:hypothetical protein
MLLIIALAVCSCGANSLANTPEGGSASASSTTQPPASAPAKTIVGIAVCSDDLAITVVDSATGQVAAVMDPPPQGIDGNTFQPTGFNSAGGLTKDQQCGSYSYDVSLQKVAGSDGSVRSEYVAAYFDMRLGKVVDLEEFPNSNGSFSKSESKGMPSAQFDSGSENIWWYRVITHQDDRLGMVYDKVVVAGIGRSVSYPLKDGVRCCEQAYLAIPTDGSFPTLVDSEPSSSPGKANLFRPNGSVAIDQIPPQPAPVDHLSAELLPATKYTYGTIRPSSDGKHGAFAASDDGERWSIWTVAASGGEPVKVADLPPGRRYRDVIRYGAITVSGRP